MFKSCFKWVLFSLILSQGTYLRSVAYTWNGSTSSDWGTANNWTPSTNYPGAGAGDTAAFSILVNPGYSKTPDLPTTGLDFSLDSFDITTGSSATYDFTTSGGSLSYTGSSTITGGIISFAHGVLSGEVTSTLTTSGTSQTTFSGAQTIPTLAITGTSTVILNSATVISSVGTTVNASGATLQGSGTISGPLTVTSGTISPGTATTLGTMSVVGTYTQGASGTYSLQINTSGSSDLINVTGAAVLDGTVNLVPLSGTYTEGTSYTILSASSGITGNFASLVETHPLSFSLSKVGNNILLTIDTSSVLSPISLNLLSSNAQKVGTSLFIVPATAGSGPLGDLISSVTSAPAASYESTLIKLTPIQTGAFPLVGLQNNIRMANALSNRQLQTFCCSFQKNKKCNPIQRQMWVEPIGFYYHQNGRDFFYEFDAYTYGTAFGLEFPVGCATFVSSLGYTHTGIVWSPTRGDASMNSIYLDFGTTLFGKRSFWQFLVQGNIDFCTLYRNVYLPGLKGRARSHHNSYNLLLQTTLGKQFDISKKKNWMLQPEFGLNYLNFFQEGFKEYGSGSSDLYVHYKHSTYLQPNLKMRLIKTFQSARFCYNPNIYLGWLVDIPMDNCTYNSNFYRLYPGHFTFKTESYHFVTNQLVVGGQFIMTRLNNFLFTAGFEADILSRMSIYALSSRVQWNF